jgi:L-cystine uptake protein TcyP (sodium:dicarboxylate symporter family)
VSVAIKSLLSFLVLLLLFEGMVTAFHLLNLPSNLAVIEGTCLLLLLAAVGIAAFRGIWNRRWG